MPKVSLIISVLDSLNFKGIVIGSTDFRIQLTYEPSTNQIFINYIVAN